MSLGDLDPRALRVIKIVGLVLAVIVFILITREPAPPQADPAARPSTQPSASATTGPDGKLPVPIPAPGNPPSADKAEAYAAEYLTRANTWRYDTDLEAWQKDVLYYVSPTAVDPNQMTTTLTMRELADCAAARCERVATVKFLESDASGTRDDYAAFYEVVSVTTIDGKKTTERAVWSIYAAKGDPRVSFAENLGDITLAQD